MAYQPIERTRVYEMTCELADDIFQIVSQWDAFNKHTVGGQLVRAIDSIGANLVEGDSRGSDLDSNRFFRYARGSAREARYWLERAHKRSLLSSEAFLEMNAKVNDCGKMISGLIEFRKDSQRNQFVKEDLSTYSPRGNPGEFNPIWDATPSSDTCPAE